MKQWCGSRDDDDDDEEETKCRQVGEETKGRFCEQALTDPQLEVVEGVLVDLLDALVEGDGEVCQCTQMAPFIFTLLWEEEE